MNEMLKYINRIRNEQKRDYAKRYAIWLFRDQEDKQIVVEPQPHQLSYMGAQAVRFELHSIYNKVAAGRAQ